MEITGRTFGEFMQEVPQWDRELAIRSIRERSRREKQAMKGVN